MSKIALEGNSLGSGTFTIASPNSNSNYTLTLPSSTGTVVVTGGAQTIEFAAGSAASPSITFTGDTNTGIFSPTADTIAFSEGGVEAMRIDSDGDVGIGTSSPAFKLDISGGGTTAKINTLDTHDGGASLSTWMKVGRRAGTGTNAYINTLHSGSDAVSALTWAFGTSGTGTEVMRIDSSGNVGIGTSPSLKFDVKYEGASASGGVYLVRNNTINLRADVTGTTSAQIGTETSHPFLFVTGGTERARITSGGNLLVGTTDSDYRIRALGTSSIGGLRVDAPGSGSYWPVYFNDTDNTSSSQIMVDIRRADTRVGYIATTNTATNYATSSDYRLKENITPMIGALNTVAQLNPVTYTWKVDGSAGQGFIAHEMQEVCPDAVTGEKDATEIQRVEVSPAIPATYDEDGNELTPTVEAVYEEREVPVYQGVDTSFLVATLTAAIQELKAITDAQATRIEALEAEVAALKGQ